MSEGLDPRMLLRGYAAGIFPMADSRDAGDIFWVEPRSRAIIPLDGFHLSRSLAKRIRSDRFRVTRDRAFHQVLLACADRPETWINSIIERATLGLHAVGHAHSIECWHDGELVGGLYGVKLGRAFFESGPMQLLGWFSGWVRRRQEAGALGQGEPMVMAEQFLALLRTSAFMRRMLGLPAADDAASEAAAIEASVEAAVATFLAAFGSRPARS